MPSRPTICLAGFILLILATTALLHGPAATGSFFFDDYNSIMNDLGELNPLVRSPLPALKELRAHPGRPDRSLAWLTFALSYRFSGLSATAFRIVNLVLHGLITMLLYLILCRLFARAATTGPEMSPSRLSRHTHFPATLRTGFFLRSEGSALGVRSHQE